MKIKLFLLLDFIVVSAFIISCTPDTAQSNNSISTSSSFCSIESSDSSISLSSSESISSSEESTSLAQTYHVTFLNDDDSLLYEVDVLEGEEAIYGGETPIKEEDEDYTYTFKGWDKDLTSITSDIVTKAEYNRKSKWSTPIWF